MCPLRSPLTLSRQPQPCKGVDQPASSGIPPTGLSRRTDRLDAAERSVHSRGLVQPAGGAGELGEGACAVTREQPEDDIPFEIAASVCRICALRRGGVRWRLVREWRECICGRAPPGRLPAGGEPRWGRPEPFHAVHGCRPVMAASRMPSGRSLHRRPFQGARRTRMTCADPTMPTSFIHDVSAQYIAAVRSHGGRRWRCPLSLAPQAPFPGAGAGRTGTAADRLSRPARGRARARTVAGDGNVVPETT